MTEEEIKVIDVAISNKELELYGSFSFENLRDILGHDSFTNTLLKKVFLDVIIIPRTGVSGGTHSVCTLNQRWRDLKRCGGYAELLNWENEQQIRQDEKVRLEYELIKSQNDFQTLNNEFITKQSTLIDSQIRTNDNVISNNRILKRIFFWTMVFIAATALPPIFSLFTHLTQINDII